MCKFKLDTGSDGNLMPVRMYKLLLPQTNIDELNKSINKKIVLHTYSNSCIEQMGKMGICHISIINKALCSNAVSL